MKANELRHGNLVQLYRKPQHKEKSFHKIHFISPDLVGEQFEMFAVLDDGFSVNVLTGIEPIPLTEEWLIKFGFVRELDWLDLTFRQISITYEDGIVYLGCGDYYETPKDLPIKHVHQLQNLYFALTGKELTIKE